MDSIYLKIANEIIKSLNDEDLCFISANKLNLIHPKQNIFIYGINSLNLYNNVLSIVNKIYNDTELVYITLDKSNNYTIKSLKISDFNYNDDHKELCLFIRSTNFNERNSYDIDDLIDIIEVLRGDNGCPWDRKQTHKTIMKSLIEECYETVSALNSDDKDMFCNELGDVLLQIIMCANIAKENNEFDIYDITTHISSKMIRRHSHIFGDDICNSAEDVLEIWQKQKNKEKNNKSALDKYDCLPAILKASKILKKLFKDNEYKEENILNLLYEKIDKIKNHIKNRNNLCIQSVNADIGIIALCIVYISLILDVDLEQELNKSTNLLKNNNIFI